MRKLVDLQYPTNKKTPIPKYRGQPPQGEEDISFTVQQELLEHMGSGLG
jgi:hypothetical protein